MGLTLLTVVFDKGWSVWVGVGVGGLMTAGCAAAGLWREELTVDLVNRTYNHREGFWPLVKTKRGSLSEFAGVKLTTRFSPSGADMPASQVWNINLIDYRGEELTELSSRLEEVEAYRDLERYARKLKLPAIDQTGHTEVVTKPEELEHAALWGGMAGGGSAGSKGSRATEESDHPPEFPAAPWPHRITVSGAAARKTIVLPPMDFDAATRRRAIVRSVLAGLGIALVIGAPFTASLLPFLKSEDPVRGFAGMALFVFTFFLGLMLIFSSGVALWNLSQSRTRRTTVEDLGESIRICEKSWGRKPRTALVRKSEIHAVELKPILLSREFGDPSRNLGACGIDLEIRTATRIHHLGDLRSPEELEWLKQAVTAMARYQPKGKKAATGG